MRGLTARGRVVRMGMVVLSRVLLVLALGLVAVPEAAAVTVTFTFDGPPATGIADNTLSANNGDTIDTYMTNLWQTIHPGSSINVKKGARADFQAPENISGSPLYLGNTNYFTGRGNGVDPDPSVPIDMYLFNRWQDYPSCIECDRIKIVFTGDGVYSFDVDWELFPVTTNSTDKVDFKIYGDGILLFADALEAPGNPMRQFGKLGHFSSEGALVPDGGWHTLEFVDWNSAPVGIDNLRIDPPRGVPEPGTLMLVGAGLAALALRRKRQ